LPQDDPLQRRPDISLAHKSLGWKPKVRLEEGLVKTIEYFRYEITPYQIPLPEHAEKEVFQPA
jgi:dTDP-D-glucose 4,6-dehydratase